MVCIVCPVASHHSGLQHLLLYLALIGLTMFLHFGQLSSCEVIKVSSIALLCHERQCACSKVLFIASGFGAPVKRHLLCAWQWKNTVQRYSC